MSTTFGHLTILVNQASVIGGLCPFVGSWVGGWDCSSPLPNESIVGHGSVTSDGVQIDFSGVLKASSAFHGYVVAATAKLNYSASATGGTWSFFIQNGVGSVGWSGLAANSAAALTANGISCFTPQFLWENVQLPINDINYTNNPGFIDADLVVSLCEFVVEVTMPVLASAFPAGCTPSGGITTVITLTDVDATGVDLTAFVLSIEFGEDNIADMGTFNRLSNTQFSIEVPPALDGPEIVNVIINSFNFTGYPANAAIIKSDGFEYFTQFQFNMTTSVDPLPGSGIVTITSDPDAPIEDNPLPMKNITEVHLEWNDGTDHEIILFPWEFILWYTNELIFWIPFGFSDFEGPVEITAILEDAPFIDGGGHSVHFSGSVPLGTIDILFEDASGIYRLVKNKKTDTLYNPDRSGEILDVKIPRPFGRTGFIGG